MAIDPFAPVEPSRAEMRDVLDYLCARGSRFGHPTEDDNWVLLKKRHVEVLAYMRARLGAAEKGQAVRK